MPSIEKIISDAKTVAVNKAWEHISIKIHATAEQVETMNSAFRRAVYAMVEVEKILIRQRTAKMRMRRNTYRRSLGIKLKGRPSNTYTVFDPASMYVSKKTMNEIKKWSTPINE